MCAFWLLRALMLGGILAATGLAASLAHLGSRSARGAPTASAHLVLVAPKASRRA